MVRTKENLHFMHEAYLVIDRERCLSCGACAAVCGPGSLLLRPIDLLYDPSTCVRCGECVCVCPTAALVPANHTRKNRSVT